MIAKIKNIKLILLIALIGGFAAFVYVDANSLGTTQYTVSSKNIPEEFDGFKILHLSDLHSKQFGTDNELLIEKIKAVNPDIIVATGDMTNSKNDDGTVFYLLAKELVKDFDIYYIRGNHEQIAEFKAEEAGLEWFKEYIEKLKQIGVNVLENEKVQIIRGHASINIYGLDISLRLYRGNYSDSYEGESEIDAESIKDTLGRPDDEEYDILLTHNPKYFPIYSQWGADLVLSGHIHGGLIRLPFVGGLLSPDVSFFPKYDAGEFEIGKSKMIVSRGLGDSVINLRVFNSPELVVITLASGL